MARGDDVLLRARSHFRAARTVETLQKISVPEWDAEIYYWPEMSVEEKRAIFRHWRVTGGRIELPLDGMLAAAVTNVCLRARDAFGERMFTDAQEDALLDTHPDVLQRVSNEMGWGSRVPMEDAEKN